MSRRRSLSLLAAAALAVCLAAPAAADPAWAPVGPGLLYGSDFPYVFVTHPGSPRTLWIAEAGAVIRSTDGGATWRQVSGGLGEVWGLAGDLSAPGALWAATQTAVFHTGDGGDHWQAVSDGSFSTGLGDQYLLGLAATRKVDAALYAWTERRVLESTDGGRSWRLVVDLDESLSIEIALPASAGILYLSVSGPAGHELRKTRDGGATWTVLPCPDGEHGIGRLTLSQAMLFLSPRTASAGLQRSTDGGTTWREVLAGGPFGVLADPSTPGTLWALDPETRHLWLTRDNGGSWTPLATPPIDHLGAAGPEPGTLYGWRVGWSGGAILRNTTGGVSAASWTSVLPLFDGPPSPPTRISFQPGHPSRLAFVILHELFRSDDGGATWWWLPTAPGDVNDVAIDPNDANRLFAVGWNHTATSADGGRTWTQRSTSLGAALMVRATPTTLFAGGCGLLRSRDNGRTWLQVLACSGPRNHKADQRIQKLAVDPAHPDLVFALAFLDPDFSPSPQPMDPRLPTVLWRSADGGRTWRNVANDLDAFEYDAQSALLWGVRADQLLLSHDLGATWQTMARVPGGASDLVAPPGLPGTLYVSSYGDSLWRTQDNGRTWERVAPGGDRLLTLAPGAPRTLFGLSDGVVKIRMPK